MPSRNYATEEDIDKNESRLDDEDLTIEALLSESDDSDYKYEEKIDVDDEEDSEENRKAEENSEADDDDCESQSDNEPEGMSRRRLKLCELADKWEADPKEPWQRGVCRCSKTGPSWIMPGGYASACSSIMFQAMVSYIRDTSMWEQRYEAEFGEVSADEEISEEEIAASSENAEVEIEEALEHLTHKRQGNLHLARKICIKLLRGVLADLSILEMFALEIDAEGKKEIGVETEEDYSWTSIFLEPRIKGPFLHCENEDDEEIGDVNNGVYHKDGLYRDRHWADVYDSDTTVDGEFQRETERGMYPKRRGNLGNTLPKVYENPKHFKRRPI